MRGQVNAYRGVPARPVVKLRLAGLDGSVVELDAVVDTGSPLTLVLDLETFTRFAQRETKVVPSNFGALSGGWIRALVPQTRFDREVRAYGSDTVIHAIRQSDRLFDALVGLPLLRLFEYGGDADGFWIRDASR